MTCKQMGGACDTLFFAETFDEIAELKKTHNTEMFMKRDKSHLNAMKNLIKLMEKTATRDEWFNTKREEFEALPEFNHQCGCTSCGCNS